MLVKNDYVSKHDVVFVKENNSKQDVLNVLTDSGYRCIPVLDEKGEKFAGNIYKVHLLEHEKDHGGFLDGTVAELIQNEDGHAKEGDSFFTVFSSIKRLPYLAIVDDSKNFLGILTNGNVLQVLENAWGANNGSYSLTIGTIEYAGALQKMLRVVNRHCNVQSVISLNNNSNYVRRVCIVLPMEVDTSLMKTVCDDLEVENFTVTDIEKLN